MDILLFIGTGLLAGTLSGLLGIGGGTIIVPSLSTIYTHIGFTHIMIMHMAAGTSFATMIFTTPAALRAHMKTDILRWDIFTKMVGGMVVCTVLGVLTADVIHTSVLRGIFAFFLITMSVRMLFFSGECDDTEPHFPGKWGMLAVGSFIGFLAGLLGVGGGAIAVPYLLSRGLPMKYTVGVASLCTMVVATLGTCTAMYTGFEAPGLPQWSVGYVYWPAVFAVVIPSSITAYLAAPLAHRLPTLLLKRVFGVFILLVAIHMLSYMDF